MTWLIKEVYASALTWTLLSCRFVVFLKKCLYIENLKRETVSTDVGKAVGLRLAGTRGERVFLLLTKNFLVVSCARSITEFILKQRSWVNMRVIEVAQTAWKRSFVDVDELKSLLFRTPRKLILFIWKEWATKTFLPVKATHPVNRTSFGGFAYLFECLSVTLGNSLGLRSQMSPFQCFFMTENIFRFVSVSSNCLKLEILFFISMNPNSLNGAFLL